MYYTHLILSRVLHQFEKRNALTPETDFVQLLQAPINGYRIKTQTKFTNTAIHFEMNDCENLWVAIWQSYTSINRKFIEPKKKRCTRTAAHLL